MIIKGINDKMVNRISTKYKESTFFTILRNDSLSLFNQSSKPIFGPDMKIDYDNMIYYDDVKDNNISKHTTSIIKKYNINKENLIIQSDYHNIYNSVDDTIICTDFNDAYINHSDIFNQYFNKIIKYDENIYTLLSNTVFNNTLFIYIPPHINAKISKIVDIVNNESAIINRVLIVVDSNSTLEFTNIISSLSRIKKSMLVQNIEIYLKKHATCRFKTLQDLSNNIYNISIKRAQLESYCNMEWIEVNKGSLATMSYPTSLIYGKYSHSKLINITGSDNNQQLDIGGRLLHQSPNTKSEIINYSFVKNNGFINSRHTIRISTASVNSQSKIKNNIYLFDNNSTFNMIPRDIIRNNLSSIEHNTLFKKTKKEYQIILDEIINKYF